MRHEPHLDHPVTAPSRPLVIGRRQLLGAGAASMAALTLAGGAGQPAHAAPADAAGPATAPRG